jgi:predicted transcriptional regulator
MDISGQIADRRAKLHLPQSEVAKLAGIRQSHLSAIETRKLDARGSTLTDVARALRSELVLVPIEILPAVRSLLSGDPMGERRLFTADPD